MPAHPTLSAAPLARVDALAALQDPVRRAVYAHVREAPQAVTREQTADAVGISRKLAAFHLEKLVDAGLVMVLAEPAGVARKVGRRPKAYVLSSAEIQISIPPREHTLLADILLDAVLAERGEEDARQAALRIAAQRGRALGEQQRPGTPAALDAERALRVAETALRQHGFEPARCASDVVQLRNCPFHPLAAKAPELVCELNRAFIAGYLDGIGARTVEAAVQPASGRCCVLVRATRGDPDGVGSPLP